MRDDLPSMNAGKAMAQAAHASNQFIGQWGHLKMVKEWQKEAKHFGTTIVLAVDKSLLLHALKRAQMRDGTVPFGAVYDDTYPFITTTEIEELIPKRLLTAPSLEKADNQVLLFRKELTCAYVFVSDGSNDQADIVGDLHLHP